MSSDTAAAGGILLKDEEGFKYKNIHRHLVRSNMDISPESTVTVKHGELVKYYNHLKKKYNYTSQSDQSVFLKCDDEDVAPLHLEEFLLLEGFDNPADRYTAFTEGLMEFGLSLVPDSKVFVVTSGTSSAKQGLVRATVRYVGEVEDLPGTQFGVELNENTEEGNDGSHEGHEYFHCNQGYGLFVPLSRVIKYSGERSYEQSSTMSREQVKAKPRLSKGESSHNDGAYNNPQPHPMKTESQPHSVKTNSSSSTYRVGDRVRYHSKSCVPYEGVVKWIGSSTSTRNLNYVHVGILTDDIISPTDFEMNVPGLSYYISAPDQRALFIPESMVEKIEQKGSNKAIEKRKSAILGEEIDHPIQETLNKQPYFTEEDNHSKKQKEKAPRKSSDRVDQLEEFKQVQVERSELENKRGFEDQMNFVKPVRGRKDPSNYHHHQHLQSYEDRGKLPLNIQKYEQEGTYSYARNSSLLSNQSSRSSAHYSISQPSVDKKQTRPCSVYDPSQDIQIGSRVQLPSTEESTAIYGSVHWIGTVPKCEGYIAGIELDECLDGCTNGVWRDSNGKSHQLFLCEDGKGLLYPADKLKLYQKPGSNLKNQRYSNAKKTNWESSGESHQGKTSSQKDDRSGMLERRLDHAQQVYWRENEEPRKSHNNYDTPLIQMPQGNWWKIDRSELKRTPQTYLGVGAWGVVYSAEFKGEQVAIKHAHRELLSLQGTVEMVKREISILSRIHHPNLVRFIGAVLDHDVESKRDVPIIVLELLDMNLRTAYSDKSLNQSTMASIFCDVAYALHYLHEQTPTIIHRDVSAPNILLKKRPNQLYQAKVSDFGSANLARQSSTAGAGAIIYTAPEMFPQEDLMADPPEQTAKVDVYSFGIVMLEVVCREMPAPEKRKVLLETCEIRWRFIYDLIQQCSKRNPNDRPTMRELLQYIRQIKTDTAIYY